MQPLQTQTQPELFKIFSHRSGIETYWRCQRASYLELAHTGTGIQRHPKAFWLDVGTAVHLGLAGLISLPHTANTTSTATGTVYSDVSVDTNNIRNVIQAAVNWFRFESGQDQYLPNMSFEEQCCLIEALLWSFAVFTLPSFLETYRIIWVEKEVTQIINSNTIELIRMSRPDAVVQDRQSGEVAVISWKTIDSATDWRRRFYKHDLQGLMEMGFARQLLAAEKQRVAAELMHPNETQFKSFDERIAWMENEIAQYKALPTDVDYVQTIFLQKGKRKKVADPSAITSGVAESNGNDAGAGMGDEFGYISDFDDAGITYDASGAVTWQQDTFLIYPYIRLGDSKVPDNPDLSWKWRYKQPGKASYNTLGTSYKKGLIALADIDGGIEAWVRALHANTVFPSGYQSDLPNPLEQVVIWEMPSYRNERMLKRMLRQTELSEIDRARKVLEVEELLRNTIRTPTGHLTTESIELFEDFIDEKFPQALVSCSHPWKCQYQDICHSGMPLDPQIIPAGFDKRVPHHLPELEWMQKTGRL